MLKKLTFKSVWFLFSRVVSLHKNSARAPELTEQMEF